MDAESEQGTEPEGELVREIFPWISPRLPDSPAFANVRTTVANFSDPTVNGVGVPMSPLALRNEIAPLQYGACEALFWPEDDATAVFTTVIDTVSVAARPIGGKT